MERRRSLKREANLRINAALGLGEHDLDLGALLQIHVDVLEQAVNRLKERRALKEGAERHQLIFEARRMFHALWGDAKEADEAMGMVSGLASGYSKVRWEALQQVLSDLLGEAI